MTDSEAKANLLFLDEKNFGSRQFTTIKRILSDQENPVGLVDHIEMRKTDCFGKTRLVPHIPSSS